MNLAKVGSMLVSRCCKFGNNNSAVRTYKSVYSLDKLYPNANVSPAATYSFTTITDEKFSGEIPQKVLKFKYSRSSGPGGQHVNKTETKVEARFNVMSAKWLPVDTRSAISKQYRKIITKEGDLVVSSGQSRYRLQNVKNCMEEIKGIIDEVQKPRDTSKEEEIAKLYSVENLATANKKRLKRKKINSFNKAMRNDF